MKIVFHERFCEEYASDPAAAGGRMEAIVKVLGHDFEFLAPRARPCDRMAGARALHPIPRTTADRPPSPNRAPSVRVALVHDWLTGMRGGERVLELLCRSFPQAPIYTLIHNPAAISDVTCPAACSSSAWLSCVHWGALAGCTVLRQEFCWFGFLSFYNQLTQKSTNDSKQNGYIDSTIVPTGKMNA